MDLEAREDFDESSLIFQNDNITYKDAYKLNKFKHADTQQIIEVISGVLIEILKETDKIPDQITTSFHAKSVPAIGVKDYLARIAKCSKCSDECLILALIYIDKITERNKKFIIKSLNIHRLLITGVMVAAKFFDDQFYNNEYYAKVGGISNKEINSLEIEFLNYVNFSLYVDPILFFKYRQRLLSQIKEK